MSQKEELRPNRSLSSFLKNRRTIYGSIIALAAVAFLFSAFIGFRDNIFRWMINPQTPFQTYVPPAQPDYSNREAWALAPETPPPGAWEDEWGVDVFFVHPTTYYSSKQWNAPIDDQDADRRLVREALPNHALPFARAGVVYAPRYRQPTLLTELNFGEDSRQSILLAYTDIKAAFDEYMDTHNRGRAIILVGVQQGGLFAQRLLEERFNTPIMRERLVAAYLINSATPVDLFEDQLAGLGPCNTPEDIKCIVSWGVVFDGEEAEADRFRNRSKTWTTSGNLVSTAGRRLVCVNPLLWSTAGDFAPNRLHRGGARAVGLELDSHPAVLPGAVGAQCVDGVLITDRPREKQLRRQFDLGARFKTPTYNLFYADIEKNAETRAQISTDWLKQHGAKPARPLPPAQAVEPAPINEVNDPVVNPPIGAPSPSPDDKSPG